jgi:myosin heavy subunit
MSEDLNKKLLSVAQDLAIRSIEWAAQQYSFDANEALRMLNLSSGKIESKKQVEKKPKEVVVKPSFPLPYNGEHSDSCCQALRQNNGLYTQCQSSKKTGSEYCKSCDLLASKSENGIPEYGTVQMRLAVDIQEYIDPKGRKPVSYTKVMKKFKVNEDQVMEEAGKFNISINPIHFEVAESESKRGRPKAAAKAPKEPKGAKGRPKKEKKVLAIEGEEEDLFATLVANASINDESSDDEEIVISSSEKPNKKQQDDAKAAKALKKQQEEEAKALKKQQEEEAKAAKALKKQQEEEARAIKKQQEEEAKALKKLQEEAEKAEKAALKEQERIAKEEAKALKKQEEEAARAAKGVKSEKSGKTAKSSKKEAEQEEDEEPDVVKKIEFEGKKYLKSKKTGIIYDYNEYVQNQEQVVVGKWNESKNKIEFTKADSDSEEEEEDYDE